MNFKYIKILVAFVVLLASNEIFSQRYNYSKIEIRADEFYSKNLFHAALPLYEELEERYDKSTKIKSRLAKIYYYLGDNNKSLKYFEDIKYDIKDSANLNLLLSQIYASQGKFDEAIKSYNIYSRNCENCNFNTYNLDYYDNLAKDSLKYSKRDIPINTEQSEYFPTFYQDGFSYVTKNNKRVSNNLDLASFNPRSQHFSDIYTTDKYFENKTKLLSQDIDQSYNQGPVSFYDDYKKMYITRNNQKGVKGVYGNKDDEFVKLNIFQSIKNEHNEFACLSPVLKGDKNDLSYNYGHPTVSKDGKFVVFMSDMPGGFGGADLYISKIINDNVWGEPVNLGPNINTPNNEYFPFLSDDGYLYFSSNGHLGYGGYDIYASYMVNDNFVQPINIGPAINSIADESSFAIRNKDYLALITTNEGNSVSNNYSKNVNRDDIIAYYIKPEIIKISFVNARTKKSVNSVYVANLIKGDTTFSGTRDHIKFANLPILDARFIATAEGYFPKEFSIGSKNYKDTTIELIEDLKPITINFEVLRKEDNTPLDNIPVTITGEGKSKTFITKQGGRFTINDMYRDIKYDIEYMNIKDEYSTVGLKGGENLSKVLYYSKADEFNNLFGNPLNRNDIDFGKTARADIYYDLNSFEILNSEKPILMKLVKYLMDNPNINVELGSHTDCYNTEAYNMELSKKRSMAAVRFITSNGIKNSRITPKWYGESRQLSNCKCENNTSDCPDSKLQMDRRTEIKIVK